MTKTGSLAGRATDIVYFKTMEPLFNAMSDFARGAGDYVESLSKGTSATAKFIGVSPEKVRQIQKILGSGKEKWLKKIVNAAARAKALLKAYNKALSDTKTAIAKKMNGAWAEGILKLIDDKLLKSVLTKYFIQLIKNQKKQNFITLNKKGLKTANYSWF